MGQWEPSAVWASFDGSPDRVALFLGQVIDHLEKYGHLYTSQWAMVMGMAAVMEGEAAYWVADLYSDHAGELGDIGLFLSALQEKFEDNARMEQAEGELLAVRQ